MYISRPLTVISRCICNREIKYLLKITASNGPVFDLAEIDVSKVIPGVSLKHQTQLFTARHNQHTRAAHYSTIFFQGEEGVHVTPSYQVRLDLQWRPAPQVRPARPGDNRCPA